MGPGQIDPTGRRGATATVDGPWFLRLSGEARLDSPGSGSVTIPGKQASLVLALLAVERRAVPREEIADLLWGEAPLPDHWPNAVRIVLSKIRAAVAPLGLPGSVVVSAEGRVRLDLPGRWETDADRARHAVAHAESLLAGSEQAGSPTEDTDHGALHEAIELGRGAEDLLTGPLPPGFDGPWATRLARSRQELLGRAFLVQARAELALADPAAAAATAETRVAVDPLDEAAHHLLIRALLADGRTAAAWRAFARLTQVLDDELGVAPAEETRALLADPVVRPAAPAVAPGSMLLGRREQLQRLDALWSSVLDSGRPGLMVVEGPTGIGKTRLVREFGDRVEVNGGQILWGTCHSGSGLPYEPLLGALRDRLADRRAGDPTPGPALASLLGSFDTATGLSPATARTAVFRDLFDLTTALLRRPTVWVIDDLQWASQDTTAFVDLLVGELAAPLLVVVITRNTPAPIAEALARWQKSAPLARTLPVTPLTASELAPLVATLPTAPGKDRTGTEHSGDECAGSDRAGAQRADERQVADELHRRTGGHPFFVTEVAREALRQGRLDLTVIPDGVRDWIRRRAEALPTVPARILELAAVIGEQVPVGLLARCSPEPLDEALGCLELLTEHGFLTETVDGFGFPHRITPEVVYDRIGAHRRAVLHLTVATGLEAGDSADPALMAHHLARSGPETSGRAVPFAVQAAERNLAVGAWESAETVLLAVEHLSASTADRASAAVALGVAAHQLGRPQQAQQALERAVELAREAELAPELAAAALKMVGRGGRGAAGSMSDQDRIALLREAAAALDEAPVRPGPGDGSDLRDLLRVRIEGELGWALLFTGSRAERRSVALAGLDRLSTVRDPSPELVAQAVFNARSVRTGGVDVPIRMAETRRVLALPASGLTADVRLAALVAAHEDAVRVDDRPAAAQALTRVHEAAHRAGHRYWQWAVATWSSLDRAVRGDLDGAETDLAAATARYSGTAREVEACYAVQLVCLRLLAGRGAEILPLIGGAADLNPHIPCYRAVHALAAAESGDRDTAAAALAECARDGFADLPDDSNRFLALAVLGDVAASLGRVAEATTLIDLLLPWSGQQILLNCYGGGGAYWGPVDRVLGRLGHLTGDDRAHGWFAAAADQAVATGSPWALARVQRDSGAPFA